MAEEPGTFPKDGVPDEDDSGMLSHPTDPHAPIDEAGPEGTREAGKVQPERCPAPPEDRGRRRG
jgi:hypothetical protein